MEKRMSVYVIVVHWPDKESHYLEVNKETAERRASAYNALEGVVASVSTGVADTVFMNKEARDEYDRRVADGDPLIWDGAC